MDLAAVSTAMSQYKLQADTGLAVMNKTKSTMEEQGDQLVDMLQQSVPKAPHPTHGHNIDISK